jgi:hypothetical protein
MGSLDDYLLALVKGRHRFRSTLLASASRADALATC